MSPLHTSGLLAYQSDHVEDLVDQLVVEMLQEEKRRAQTLSDLPFLIHQVVIPTRNLETYLNFEISARRGIAANVEFITMERFLESLLPTDDNGEYLVRLLDQTAVTRQILHLIDHTEIIDRVELRAVQRFIYPADEVEPTVVEHRKYQFANRLAHLFEEYGYARQNLLRHWRSGEPALKKEYPNAEITDAHLEIERWQMTLWNELFGADGCAHSPTDGDDRPWMLLPEAIAHFAAEDNGGLQWPQSIHVFGHSYLPRFFRDLFSTRTYAEDGRLALYVMTPSLEHWSHGVAGDRDEDPVFEILAEESPLEGDEFPLPLAVWGRAGRDYQRMIDAVAFDRDDVSLSRENESHTLLQTFQEMIREMKTAREVFADRDLPGDTKSLNLWSCPSIQRECETIASEIWELVTTHSDLRFNDIAVVVQPGDRSTYQTHLQAAFSRTGNIPCNVIDVEGTGANPFLEAAQLLLELPLGSFRRRELLALLVHPCVLANHPGADETSWLNWCDAVNVFQGGTADDLQDTYLSEDRFTWGQGMRRLVLGAFMSQRDPERPQPLTLDGNRYLPHETDHQNLETVALLTMLVDELIAGARADRSAQRPLAEWMEHFSDLVSRHIKPRDRAERRTRMQLLGSLQRVADADTNPDEAVGYRTAFDFASAAMSQLEDSRGQYLADGVVISAFRPMRPIPFEVVFVTGLGEGKFPAPEPPDMLDLRRVKSEMHDVNPRYRDQYMFLETLISTRSRLYLSWVGRHGITGEPLQPASAVHQLREMILEMAPNLGENAEEIRHRLQARLEPLEIPLRRYDSAYFPRFSTTDEAPEVIDAGGPDAIPPRATGKNDDENKERVWPNHHREAKREARAQAIRRRLHDQLPEGYLPTMQQLRQVLDAEVFDELADAVEWCAPTVRTLPADEARHSLQIRHLRKFLEDPMQGSALVVLRLYDEDDKDVLDADHEPFEADRLTRLMLVRRSFSEILRRGDLSDDGLQLVLDEKAQAAELAGELPAELFFDAEREKCLGELRSYAEALGGEQFSGKLKRVRFGPAHRRREVDEQRDPLVLNIDIDGVPTEVELHGTIDVVDDGEQLFPLQMAGNKASSKYFLRGGFESLVLRAAELEIGGEIRVVTKKGKLKSKVMSEESPQQALNYLQDLTGQLLGGVHDYFFPVELACSAIAEKFDVHSDAALRQTAQNLKDNDYKRVSTEYGPVSNWQHVEPPDSDEARDYLQIRYAIFGELLT